ncbi:hypothetical protein [Rhodocista pekingensis]|uniref:SHOCT domain-containing protein n=1 Tax=Rhodocista pekingensis TaxID=201185 RepID=A0ABW2KSG0_9PROT
MAAGPGYRGGGYPAAAGAVTDEESGTEAPDRAEDDRRARQALTALFRRGLIPEAEYRARLARLGGAGATGEGG